LETPAPFSGPRRRIPPRINLTSIPDDGNADPSASRFYTDLGQTGVAIFFMVTGCVFLDADAASQWPTNLSEALYWPHLPDRTKLQHTLSRDITRIDYPSERGQLGEQIMCNIRCPAEMAEAGFRYIRVGRPAAASRTFARLPTIYRDLASNI
jgi:hypothetical protein